MDEMGGAVVEYAAPVRRTTARTVARPATPDPDRAAAREPATPGPGFDFGAIPVHARAAAHGCEVESDPGQATEVRDALESPGTPLETAVRRELEPLVGLDLSRLRVHTSEPAQRSARGLAARAYSVGQHIVFGPGEYAPGTREGRRLLAHELWHVRDSQAGPVRVRRQPQDAPVVAPAGGDQRDLVADSITFLRGAADFYSLRTAPPPGRPGDEGGGVRVHLERLGIQLAGYLRIRDTAAGLIDTALNGDARLTEQLRSAYRDAVTALLGAASLESRRRNTDAVTGDSPYQLFQRHQQVIHEWAWPRAAPDAQANVLLDRVPEAERTQIRMADTTYNMPATAIDGYFHPRAVAVPPPADTTVTVAPGGTARVRAGLARVAAALATTYTPPLQVNTTTTVALDLGRYGGDRALYRITYLQHPPPRQRELLVERQASLGTDERPPSERAEPANVFARNGFVRAGGVPGTSIDWPDDQFALLQSAVAQIPESILGSVRGLRFVRLPGTNPNDPTRGAEYNVDNHVIRVYDPAFSNLTLAHTTAGGRAATEFDRLIAHEIGHALDRAGQRPLLVPFNASIAEQSRYHPRPVPGQPGRVTLPPDEIAGWRTLHARIGRQEAALTASRSLSGERYTRDANRQLTRTEQLPAGEANDFRDAVAADGPTRITTYSNQAIVEHFAEAFSLYISEPQTLARLRPHVYAYFARRFPDPARPAPAP
jgi:hypothetical protein